MAATWQTWLISAAAATGVAGGGAIGLASAAAPTHPRATHPAAPPPGIDTAQLQAQVAQLLAEDRALHLALTQAKKRLGGEVKTSEASLRLVRAQLASAQAALSAAHRASSVTAYVPRRSAPAPAPARAVAPAPAPRPSTHTTTGASGTSGGGAGHDDGGGHDD